MDFAWPASRSDIERIQRERKRSAVELALRVPFYRTRLQGVHLDRLEDIEVWSKIPLLSKDELRALPADKFYSEFCIQPLTCVVEYWRSGGVTGRPLFYPRSAFDMIYGSLAFRRAWPLVDATAEDCVHISFPLGIHPVGHLYARTAEDLGLGTVWCGSGANTPSAVQLELIQQLKPTIWAGMASYGLHLANLAEATGVDLARSSVKKLVVAAEPLSPAKRQKLERMWGAEVFDHFGMTEASFVAGECGTHEGLHVWSDLFHVEVVDESTGLPVPEGEIGTLVVTPLWNNTMTPFLRWNSGDLVSLRSRGESDGPWSVFPVMRHARRTVGFFKVRGVNINHSELEDLMFLDADITDFKAEACTSNSGLDVLRLSIEAKRGADPESIARRVREGVSKTFETTPELEFLEPGTLGREFEASVKAARFVDKRG
jgi:phenylacetate-CoA ligase